MRGNGAGKNPFLPPGGVYVTSPTPPRIRIRTRRTKKPAMNEPTKDPPSHFSEPSKRWWGQVCEMYALEPHHLKLLRAAAEAWDRSEQARRTLKREGMFYTDRFGQPKAHPAVDVERKARDQFQRLLRELALDVAAPDENRPPVAPANAHLRLRS